MAAELREAPGHIFVTDFTCAFEGVWGDDGVGAGLRIDEHNESSHPASAAGTLAS